MLTGFCIYFFKSISLNQILWQDFFGTYYSLIAFDKRVTFWLQRGRSLPCACVYVELFAHMLAFNHYAITHVYNAANAHAQGSDPKKWSQKSYYLIEGNRSLVRIVSKLLHFLSLLWTKKLDVLPELMLLNVDQLGLWSMFMIVTPVIFQHWERNLTHFNYVRNKNKTNILLWFDDWNKAWWEGTYCWWWITLPW